VRSEHSGEASGTLRLELPEGWKAEPPQEQVTFHHRGEDRQISFNVIHAGLRESRERIRAVFDAGGNSYSEGYTVVSRPDLQTFYYYQPALQQESVVDVKVPSQLKVGYIMGAGDDIPEVLREIGMKVAMISPPELAGGDLSRYDTIVLGIRAYDTRDDVRAHNARLLDYVKNGGTLMVQYNQQLSQFNAGKYTPYPAEESHDRVTVEESPVQILAPRDAVFHYPNQITPRDFDGWVQERGLYFLEKWDAQYHTVLSMHDPGEKDVMGSLVWTQTGKGSYIYTGLSFSRQLPEGNAGAFRLFVNLLSQSRAKTK